MTSNRNSSGRRARTRAARAAMAASGENFTRAARRPGPPGTSISAATGTAESEAYEFEVLGRVLYELQRGTESIVELCRWLDFWHHRRRDGPRFIIEWAGGPYAHEVHEGLSRSTVADPEFCDFPLPYEITIERGHACIEGEFGSTCNIVIGGVRFLLRALSPIGRDAAVERSVAEIGAVWAGGR